MQFQALNLRTATLLALGTSVLYFLTNLRYIESLSWSLLTEGWACVPIVAQCLLQMLFPGVMALFFYIFYINLEDDAEEDSSEEQQDDPKDA